MNNQWTRRIASGTKGCYTIWEKHRSESVAFDRNWLEAIPKPKDLRQFYKSSSRKGFVNVMIRANDKNLLELLRSNNFLKPKSAKIDETKFCSVNGWPYTLSNYVGKVMRERISVLAPNLDIKE